jgi:putative flippase GtrA
MVGGLVTIFYLTATTVLYKVLALPFQAALAIGFAASLLLHFTLQRLFVWMHYEGFALPFRHQVGRYLTMACAQYGMTVASTAVLPRALHVSTEVVYLATMILVTTAGFLVMRFVIFHAGSGSPGPAQARGTAGERHKPSVMQGVQGAPSSEPATRSLIDAD